tara:strand:+ start:410 stop:805 length:396 start_codon:yes stop_codon:yes gene_type:complete
MKICISSVLSFVVPILFEENMESEQRLKLGAIGVLICALVSLFSQIDSNSIAMSILFFTFVLLSYHITRNFNSNLHTVTFIVVVLNFFLGMGYILYGFILFALVYYVFMNKAYIVNLLSSQDEEDINSNKS